MTKVLDNDTDNSQAYFYRGLVLSEKLGSHSEGIEDLTTAIELNPDYTEAYFKRGNAYYQLGDKQAAISDYNQVISLQPNSIDAYYNRALSYYQIQEYAQAIADLEKSANIASEQREVGKYQRAINTIIQMQNLSQNIMFIDNNNDLEANHNDENKAK